MKKNRAYACLATKATEVERRWTIAGFSKWCRGSAALAAYGAICQRSSVDGTQYTCALTLPTQRRLAAGRACSRGRNLNRAHPDRFSHRRSAPAFDRSVPKRAQRVRGCSVGPGIKLLGSGCNRPPVAADTEGRVADISCTNELIGHLRAKAVITDKGYSADAFVQMIRTAGQGRHPTALESQTKPRYNRTLAAYPTLSNASLTASSIFAAPALVMTSSCTVISMFASSAFGPFVKI